MIRKNEKKRINRNLMYGHKRKIASRVITN